VLLAFEHVQWNGGEKLANLVRYRPAPPSVAYTLAEKNQSETWDPSPDDP
jgi:hypothetical protein